jgi:acyl carrier protein
MKPPPPAITAEDILARLRAKFPAADAVGLTADTGLLESGAIDSLGLLTVVGMLETDFGIMVQDEDVVAENFGTADRLARYVSAKRGSLPR